MSRFYLIRWWFSLTDAYMCRSANTLYWWHIVILESTGVSPCSDTLTWNPRLSWWNTNEILSGRGLLFSGKKSTLGNNIYADIYLQHTIAVQWVVVWWYQATLNRYWHINNQVMWHSLQDNRVFKSSNIIYRNILVKIHVTVNASLSRMNYYSCTLTWCPR